MNPGRTVSYTLVLPAGMEILNLNHRLHWARKAQISGALKQASWALARQQHIPRLASLTYALVYEPPDKRRRDSDNISPNVKPLIDGLVAAGVLADDNFRLAKFGGCSIGAPHPKGRLILCLTGSLPREAANVGTTGSAGGTPVHRRGSAQAHAGLPDVQQRHEA